MSRVGKQPVVLPKDVKVNLEAGLCLVENSKHKMKLAIPCGIEIEKKEDTLIVKRVDDSKRLKSLHGTIRVLISNMVKGITEGFKKDLEIIGVGYKAQVKDKALILNIGFSHPVEMAVPQSLKVTTTGPTKISVEGINKQEVGEFAAKIRKNYPPEPYKGKGIRYAGEEVRKKLGKALAK